jgi:PKD repeat protein
MKRGVVVAAALLMAWAGAVRADEAKGKKPKLDLRANPRMAFSPVSVFFTAEFMGGDDLEEYHCPEIEWDWDDGGKSVQESDCQPFTPGTKIERRFTNDHSYGKAGIYNVKATFRHTDRTFAQATVRVTVRAGLGDPTIEREN